ncbi:MAG: phosphopantetheine-binding protein, partial [Pseudomonadota bacterium]
MTTLEERVTDSVMKGVARICKKDIGTLSRDTRFVDDLYIKSINVVELVSLLENEFEVEIPFGDA